MKHLLILLSLFAATGCQRQLSKPFEEASTVAFYSKSVEKSSHLKEDAIVNNLLSVKSDSSMFEWKKINNEDYLLVALWKSEGDLKYYKNNESGFYNTGNRITFVTLAPEMKQKCSKKRFGRKVGVNLRIEQLLGLPPNNKKTHFVEMWVRPQDLMRPCLDNETDDRTCGLTPKDTTDLAYRDYKKWLEDWAKDSYHPANNKQGYPFTQLGYTYDWNKRNKKHVGLSEFLIGKNKNVIVKDFVETCEYCALSCKK
jgi:hypothetical protein